jgi:hypothetical protein
MKVLSQDFGIFFLRVQLNLPLCAHFLSLLVAQGVGDQF